MGTMGKEKVDSACGKSPRARRRLAVVRVLSFCATVVLAAAVAAPRIMLCARNTALRLDLRMGARLFSRQGLVFLADLDRAHPVNLVDLSRIDVQDAPRDATIRGRRILAKGDSFLASGQPLHGISGASASYALEIAPDDIRRTQELINAMGSRSGMSLMLEEGLLRLRLVSEAGEVSTSAPYDGAPGAPTHVAVTVAPSVAILYQDGRESARVDLPSPIELRSRPWGFSNASHFPFLGAVGSLATWNRALPPREVRRVAASHRPRATGAELALRLSASTLRGLDAFLRTALRVSDRLIPSRLGNATLHAATPILTLRMRKSDERHFLRAHERSLFNGYRTRGAAKARKIDVVFGGKSLGASAWLEDRYASDTEARRPAFVVVCDGLPLLGPSGVARLYPPELHSTLHGDATRVLPLNAKLVRLYQDATFRGLYVVEPLDAPGSAWMERGDFSPKALYADGAPKPADIPPPGLSPDETLRQVASLFRSDSLFPWSAAEIKAKGRALAQYQEARGQAGGSPEGPSQSLRPKARTLPIVSISVASPVERARRRDFTCTITHPDGSDPISARGLSGFGNGLRHRGNTSYVKGIKRSLSLKFDVPLPWPDREHPTTHLLLHNGYSDPTRLRNKFSFDFYHAAAEACGRPDLPAPHFSHVELFFNGEYFGVWETSDRVRDLLPTNQPVFKVRGVNGSLWRTPDTSMLDCRTSKPDDPDPYGPMRDIFSWTSSAPESEFTGSLESRLDLDNLACYWLLLNFSANYDGRNMNQYFAVNPTDGRVTVIPWDYDKTFLGKPPSRLTNFLLSRLANERPDFTNLLKRRWRDLRAGPCTDEALFGRLDADAARLAPYMDEEWRLLKPAGFDGSFNDAVRILRDSVRAQLDFLDEVLGD